MNVFILIFIGLVGFFMGRWFFQGDRKESPIQAQSRQKAQNKENILGFLRMNEKIKNNDVEILLGVSNATAERYLDELEKEGKITQHGQIGQGVFYTKK